MTTLEEMLTVDWMTRNTEVIHLWTIMGTNTELIAQYYIKQGFKFFISFYLVSFVIFIFISVY